MVQPLFHTLPQKSANKSVTLLHKVTLNFTFLHFDEPFGHNSEVANVSLPCARNIKLLF